jgi:hypothetical protein
MLNGVVYRLAKDVSEESIGSSFLDCLNLGEIVPTDCREMSVTRCKITSRNISEERWPQLHRRGGPEFSHELEFIHTLNIL